MLLSIVSAADVKIIKHLTTGPCIQMLSNVKYGGRLFQVKLSSCRLRTKRKRQFKPIVRRPTVNRFETTKFYILTKSLFIIIILYT